jgi:ribonucleoside-diphosphate reductase alpha chain
MGFSDALEQLSMSYESPHAWDFADRVFEFISYMAIDESANLAAERGSYANFAGSGWSQGMVPFDSIERMEQDRGMTIDLPKITKQKRLDWDKLRARVQRGMRNATLMAVAPNANIGLVAGTTPGIDPRFAQVFARNKISGKYLDLNHNLVKDLKNMGLWEEMKEKIIEAQGDISTIDGLPAYFKEIYKTAFTTNPYAYIEVAARAQKWVDQALSRNMYLESRDMGDMKQVYMTAWKKGLKTTYYLHMKPRHTAEQSTTNVNKAEMTGKRGFGSIKLAAAGVPADATPSPIEFTPAPITVEAPAPAPVLPSRGFDAVSAVSAAGPAGVNQNEVHAGVTPQVTEMTPMRTEAMTETPVVAASAPVAMGFSTLRNIAPAPTPVSPAPVQTPTVPQPTATKQVFDMPDDGADSPNVCIACQ